MISMAGQCYDQTISDRAALYHGDSVQVLPGLPDNSIGLSLSSWPFSDQYTYSESPLDFGNSDGDDEFFAQLSYLLPDVLRVTIPGRMALVHAKDRIVYGTKNDGYRYIQPFSDRCIAAMMQHGWLFYGRITIATDPVRENAQTNNLGYLELQKDATRLGVGMPEYLLLFRKPHRQTAQGGTWSDKPVNTLRAEHGYTLPRWQIDANSIWRSNGNRMLLPWEADGYSYPAHVGYLEELDARRQLGRANGERIPTESPWVWWDIDRTDVLNARLAKDQGDERHICPLQLDLCERAITRWSNPDDIVLDYFAGVGSVGVQAIKQGRRFVGCELKDSYYTWMQRFIHDAEVKAAMPTLFDWLATQ
jgi:hypothetical protein